MLTKLLRRVVIETLMNSKGLYNPPLILQRERRNNKYQKLQPPFQNNLFDEKEEQENDEVDNEIHLV